MMPENSNSKLQTNSDAKISPMLLQKWGGVASILMVVAYLVAQYIYLPGT